MATKLSKPEADNEGSNYSRNPRYCYCLSSCVSKYRQPSPNQDFIKVTELSEIASENHEVKINKSSSTQSLPLPPPQNHNIGKKTLVLDLDRTLLFRSSKKNEVPLITFSRNIYNKAKDKNIELFVSLRPGLMEFLDAVSPFYEIILFTKSSYEMTNPIIDEFDPNGYISHRLFMDSCVHDSDGNVIKDISLLGRDLKGVVIVDDNSNCFQRQVSNAIECYPYFGNCDWDTELHQIKNILLEVHASQDVRVHLRGLRQKFPTAI